MAEEEKAQPRLVDSSRSFRLIEPDPAPDPLDVYTPMERAFMQAQFEEAARRKAERKKD